MKRIWGLVLGLALLLCSCGGKTAVSSASEAKPAPSREEASSRAKTLAITFSNASGYIFNEIYISPTAANELGEELLGSTRILKANGSIEVEIPAYDFDNYDILVVDEEQDEYRFTRVPLQNKSEVAIYFGDDGLAADVADARGDIVATVYGQLAGESLDGAAGEDDQGNTQWIEFSLANGTSHLVFTDLYLMPNGTTDESEIGYNHIASVAPLNPGERAEIGVDDHIYFDLILIDDGGNEWYFQEVYLEAGCLAYATNHNGAGFAVECADGTKDEYVAEVYNNM